MQTTRIRFGIQTGQQFASWDEIVRIWQRAEALGYDTAWTYDHFVAVMMDPFDPCLEAWSCLAALAVHTTRIRIGALVTGNTYRHPAILAKIATTVDVISDGRLEFGIGAGWYEPEHAMFGLPLRLGARALRASRRGADGHPRPVERTAGELRGHALPAQRGDRRAEAGAAAASADHHRRRRREAAAADRGAARRRLELVRLARRSTGARSRSCAATATRRGATATRIEKQVLVPAAITDDLATVAPLIQGYAMYQGISEDEARRWMLLGTADDVCRQIDAFLAAGVTHFVLTLSPYNFDVFERFAAEVMPRYR